MLREPTTLANIARLIGKTLELDYGIDPARLFEQAGIDANGLPPIMIGQSSDIQMVMA